MSLVADGPLMNVSGLTGSRRASSSGTECTTCGARTTQTWWSGTSDSALRPEPGEESSTIVPVSAAAAVAPVTTASNLSRSSAVSEGSSTVADGAHPGSRPEGCER